MAKSNKPIDQQSLQEAYEESKIRLLMAQYAELEGKRLLDENEELRKNPFFHPTVTVTKKLTKRLNRHLATYRFKKTILSTKPQRLVIVFSISVILLFTSVILVEAMRKRV